MAEVVQEPYEIDLTDSKTLLISDFEGTTPTAHFAKFKEYCTGVNTETSVVDKTNRVIFLGDVFDNTAQFGPNCTGEECKDPDDDEGNCVDNSNYVALETIKLLVDNEERCKFVVGNRDINKIKLIPFFSFESGEEWWTKGESYAEIVKNLMTVLLTNTDPWLIKDQQLKYFRPFWRNTDASFNEGWIEKKNINIVKFYDRFERIFGKDPAPGTMSALVTLKCIPNELFPNMEEFYKAVDDQYKKNQLKYEVNWRKKVRAILTITVFMRMLDKKLWFDGKQNRKELEKKEFRVLDGYLFRYLSIACPAYYAEYQNNLFLFAHGGIKNDFVEKDGKEEIDKIKGRDIKAWGNMLEYKQNGGALDLDNKIIKSINYYNKAFLELVNKFFDEPINNPNGDWVKPMLTLLDLSAGVKENPNQVKQPYMENLDRHKGNYEKIYNVFGHASISAGYTFGKTRDDTNNKIKGNNTYFLSTDYSTTLFKNGIVCDPKNKGENSVYNKNYLLAILDTTDDKLALNIDGHVYLQNDKPYKFKNYTKEKTIKDFDAEIKADIAGKQIEKNKKIFLPPEVKIEGVDETIIIIFDKTKNLLTEIDAIDKQNDSDCCTFNGIATIGDSICSIYSNVNKGKTHAIIALPYEGGKNEIVANAAESAKTSADANAVADAKDASSLVDANAENKPVPFPATPAPSNPATAPAPAPATALATPAPATPAKKTTPAKKQPALKNPKPACETRHL